MTVDEVFAAVPDWDRINGRVAVDGIYFRALRGPGEPAWLVDVDATGGPTIDRCDSIEDLVTAVQGAPERYGAITGVVFIYQDRRGAHVRRELRRGRTDERGLRREDVRLSASGAAAPRLAGLR